MIFIYRFFYFLLKVLVTVLKPVLPPHLKNWIVLRGQVLNKSKIDTKSYWFHASSGEIEYCKYVIRKLKESEPYCRIVVTYSSPSAEKLFANIKDVVSEFIPLPWDQAGPLSELFDYINPQILVFSRTDLWPELLHQAQIRKINTGVIAFNPKSDFLSLLSYKLFLQTLTFASCVDLALAENLKALLPSTHVSADGDTRFDQVFYRLSQEPKLNLKSESKILVLGSTWPDDERIILKNLAELKSQQIKIVLSPHEVQPDNIARLRNILSLQGLSFRCLSEFDSFIDFKFDVLIIDKIGFLADVYRFADLAFIGGSFKDKVHSVMEPLCCGLNVITGPFYKNSPEAVKYHDRFVHSVQSNSEFNKQVKKLINGEKVNILAEMKKNLNASQKVISIIQDLKAKT